MSNYVAKVQVQLKASVFDPQGHAVEQALHSLGHGGVRRVRMGKSMEVHLEAADEQSATAQVRQMCETVLCNPVMETFSFTLEIEKNGDEVDPVGQLAEIAQGRQNRT